MSGRHLFITHSLGGGVETWLRDLAPSMLPAFVLRSVGTASVASRQLRLYRGTDARSLLRAWPLDRPVESTEATNLTVRSILAEIIHDLHLDSIIVATLHGYSLDVLQTGLATLFVCHDHFPMCCARPSDFDRACAVCGSLEPGGCLRAPVPPGGDAAATSRVRRSFVAAVRRHDVGLIAPSASAQNLWLQAEPTLAPHMWVVPHRRLPNLQPIRTPAAAARLRIMVLGRLTPAKGLHLVADAVSRSQHNVDFHLIGCGDLPAKVSRAARSVVPRYEPSELRAYAAGLQPHAALLPSLVDETFSYTLSECWDLCIPPLATNRGALGQRIEHTVDGLLFEPTPKSLSGLIANLAADPAVLASIAERLRLKRSPEDPDMPERYRRLLQARSTRPVGAPFGTTPGVVPSPPPLSTAGFGDFLDDVDVGFALHIRRAVWLPPWQRRALVALASAGTACTRAAWRVGRRLRQWTRPRDTFSRTSIVRDAVAAHEKSAER